MLTDAKCRNAKAREKPYKLSDWGGLYLEVLPAGGKSWRLAYRYFGKQKRLVIGPYPTVSLGDARRARDEAKRLLATGGDPSSRKKLEKLAQAERVATTFGAIAKELVAKDEREGRADSTIAKKRWLALDLAAPLADRPIVEITASELLSILRKAEARGKHETAKRLRSACGQVFRYAIATGRASRDPSADLKGALTAPVVTHRAAITDPDDMGALWRAIDSFSGQPETRLALKLAVLTAGRPGEVRQAEWSEFNLGESEWRVPAAKMKMRREWRSPLSKQALAVIAELKPLSFGGRYLFPSIRSSKRPMSEGTMIAALRRMGYAKDEVTPHGFRSMFSTHANESRLWSPDVIEAALAHLDRDAVRRAYNRAEHREVRVQLSQWWADQLDDLAAGGKARVRGEAALVRRRRSSALGTGP